MCLLEIQEFGCTAVGNDKEPPSPGFGDKQKDIADWRDYYFEPAKQLLEK